MPTNEDIKKQLISEGVIFDSDISYDFQYVYTKHISRHIKLAKFLKSNNLSMKWENLQLAYRIQTVCKQELSKILSPIELNFKTKVIYLFENTKVNMLDMWSSDIWRNIGQEKINSKSKKILFSQKDFLKETIEKIIKRWKTYDSLKIINELSFSQLSTIIKLLKPEIKKDLFGWEHEYDSKKLDDIVNLRNHIAHVKMLFVEKINPSPHISIPLKKVINNIYEISPKEYKEDFKKWFLNYKTRKINKEATISGDYKKDMIKLFDCIHGELF